MLDPLYTNRALWHLDICTGRKNRTGGQVPRRSTRLLSILEDLLRTKPPCRYRPPSWSRPPFVRVHCGRRHSCYTSAGPIGIPRPKASGKRSQRSRIARHQQPVQVPLTCATPTCDAQSYSLGHCLKLAYIYVPETAHSVTISPACSADCAYLGWLSNGTLATAIADGQGAGSSTSRKL